jgi:PAS domain S-box-containing protein
MVVCAGLFSFQTVNFRQAFVASLQALGAVVAQNCAAPLAFDDRHSAAEVLSTLKANPSITAAVVFDAEGAVFARFGVVEGESTAGRTGPAGQVVFTNGFSNLNLPILSHEGPAGRLFLQASFGDRRRELFRLDALVLGAVVAVSLLIVIPFSSALHGYITRPVAALAEVAHNVSEKGDNSSRAPEFGADELGLLTRAFNQMLDQIQIRDRQLRESQQRFEIAVQGSSDGIWDLDLVTGSVYYSPRWKEMLGYADAEIRNHPDSFRMLLHPDEGEAVLHRIEEFLAGDQTTFQLEFRAIHKDGTVRWIHSRGVALRNEQGRAVRFAGSHSDITDRRRAEDEVRRAREKFESLVNSLHGIVWEADPKTLRLTFVSRQVESLLGHAPLLWMESPDFREQYLHPEDRAATLAALRRGIATGMAFKLEYRILAAGGRTVWIRDSISFYQDGERPARLRGLSIDITAQKSATEQIAGMQRELVESSRQAGMAEVATAVLHNVGNVLNSANTATALVVERLRRSKTQTLTRAVGLLREHRDDLAEYLGKDPRGRLLPDLLQAIAENLAVEQTHLMREVGGLQQNIDHIKEIVAMQQSFAKASGCSENLSPDELFEDALRMALGGMIRHEIRIVRHFEAVGHVLVDRHKALQILINLIRNACHALETRETGRELVLAITKGAAGLVRLQVTDNGIGIPRENLLRIFNHGFTTKKNGHGFALHSAANAAKEMGGSLQACSDGPGTGAVFALELPAAPQNAFPTPQTAERMSAPELVAA